MFQLLFGMRSARCFVFHLSCPVCKINIPVLSLPLEHISQEYNFFQCEKSDIFYLRYSFCCIFCRLLDPSPWGSCVTRPILAMPLHVCLICTSSFHKETIMRGHDRHSTTILSVIHINYMFRPILFLVIIGLDTITGENYTIYRVSQEECARLREGVPYVKLY